MIEIQRSDEPNTLKITGKNKRRGLCSVYTRYHTEFDNGQRKFKFSDIYKAKAVKKALVEMQYGKCAFCEQVTTNPAHTGSGDVEHFRPKGGYRQEEQDDLQHPAYYWLAYDWDNLLLSCEPCNRIHKKNLFPLLNPTTRAQNHHDDINDETPLLINPTQQNPENYISFHEEVPYAIDNHLYGRKTIEVFALDREQLNESRLEKYTEIQELQQFIQIAKQYPDDLEIQDLAVNAQSKIDKAVTPQAEYSAMIKAALKSS